MVAPQGRLSTNKGCVMRTGIRHKESCLKAAIAKPLFRNPGIYFVHVLRQQPNIWRPLPLEPYGCSPTTLVKEALAGMKVDAKYSSSTTYKTYHGLPLRQGSEEPIPGFASHAPAQFIYNFNVKGMPTLVMWRQEDGTASGMLTRARRFVKDAERVSGMLIKAPRCINQQEPSPIE
eukprot:1160454-Pelagomonas_calceolata.AAC.5